MKPGDISADRNTLEMDIQLREACAANGNRVEFDFSDAFWTVIHSNVTDDTQETTQETTRDGIIRLLRENPEFTRRDLARELNRGDATIKEHLANLQEEGLLKREGATKKGRWVVIKKSGR